MQAYFHVPRAIVGIVVKKSVFSVFVRFIVFTVVIPFFFGFLIVCFGSRPTILFFVVFQYPLGWFVLQWVVFYKPVRFFLLNLNGV